MLAILACMGLAVAESPNVTLTTNVYGDGQKPWYVVIDYGETVDPDTVSAEDYTVQDYEVLRTAMNTEKYLPEESITERYVLLELSTDYTTTYYGGSGVGGSAENECSEDDRPGGEMDFEHEVDFSENGNFEKDGKTEDGMGSGGPGRMSMTDSLSNQLTVSVQQTGELQLLTGIPLLHGRI